MKTICEWQDKLNFQAKTNEGLAIRMDTQAPLGSGSAPSPKQLVLAAICGCSGMDVISLLRKYKQSVLRFEIEADAPTFETHPMSFKSIQLTYRIEGEVDLEKAKEAVIASQSKYCSVSAMISKAAPISYRVVVNGSEILSGEAHFDR